MAALPALTLLECGVPPSDPIVQKAAALVRAQVRQAVTSRDTYQLALAVLFLDRLGDKRDAELIQFLALRLVAGQRLADGGWDYTCPQFDKPVIKTLLQHLKDGKQTLEQWRQTCAEGTAIRHGTFRQFQYPVRRPSSMGRRAAQRRHRQTDRAGGKALPGHAESGRGREGPGRKLGLLSTG